MDQEHLDSPKWLKHTERARAWFDNPDKNKIRTAAKSMIRNKIGEIVEPVGFSPIERGSGWEIKKRFITHGIYVQASRSGDVCYFNIAKTFKYRYLGPREVKRLS